MMKTYFLSDIMDIIGGGTPKTSIAEYWSGNIPWLSVKDFNTDDKYVKKTEKCISKLGLENSSTVLLQTGDLIISARGTVGELAMLAYPMAFNQSCYGLRAKSGIVTNNFLYYLLKHNLRILKNNTHGSVFDTITRDTFDNIQVSLPSITIQNKISVILSALDAKIETNTRINNNLEQQAMALYKNLITENEENLQEVFLSDVANITMGQSPDGSSYNEDCIGTVFYQGRAEFGFRYPTRRLFTTEPKRMAHYNDVLMSVRAPVGDINVAKEDCCIGRGLAAIQSKNNTPSFILYTMYNLKKNLNIFNGEGTIFGSINKDSLNSLKINIPPENIIMKFEKTVSPIDRLIENNCKENEQLTQLRDTLLPKLMSGEIDVSNVNNSTDKLSFSED